jgi:hypothetical protein
MITGVDNAMIPDINLTLCIFPFHGINLRLSLCIYPLGEVPQEEEGISSCYQH